MQHGPTRRHNPQDLYLNLRLTELTDSIHEVFIRFTEKLLHQCLQRNRYLYFFARNQESELRTGR